MHGLLLQLLRGQIQRRVAVAQRNRKQGRQDRRRLFQDRSVLDQQGFEFGELPCGGIIVCNARKALVIVDHRMQRARLMIRRAIQRQHVWPARLERCAHCVQEARLANAGFTRDQRHLRFAHAGAFPAMLQQAELAIPSDHRGYRVCMQRVEPALCRTLAVHLPHDDRHGKALQMHRTQARAVEQPFNQSMRAGTDDDAIRRRLGLQPRGQVWCLADDVDLLGRALTDQLADQYLAGGDPDAHAELNVAERAEARDIAHDGNRCTQSAFGVVLVRLWVAEIRQYPVAAEPRDLAAALFNCGCTARLIGPEKDAHLLRVQLRRKFCRRRQVRKQDRQLPSLGALVRARCWLVGRGRCRSRGGPAQPFLDRVHETPAQTDRKPELLEVVLGQMSQRLKVDVLFRQTRSELPESPTVQPCDYV